MIEGCPELPQAGRTPGGGTGTVAWDPAEHGDRRPSPAKHREALRPGTAAPDSASPSAAMTGSRRPTLVTTPDNPWAAQRVQRNRRFGRLHLLRRMRHG
jgi:hypothetical protein